MAHVKYKIERFLKEDGMIEVRYINPHGEISTGEKTLEDFIDIIEHPTGDYDTDGNKIMKRIRVPQDNPNDDRIVALRLTIDIETGDFITGENLHQTIAMTGQSIFDDFHFKTCCKKTSNKNDIERLVGKTFETSFAPSAPTNPKIKKQTIADIQMDFAKQYAEENNLDVEDVI